MSNDRLKFIKCYLNLIKLFDTALNKLNAKKNLQKPCANTFITSQAYNSYHTTKSLFKLI